MGITVEEEKKEAGISWAGKLSEIKKALWRDMARDQLAVAGRKPLCLAVLGGGLFDNEKQMLEVIKIAINDGLMEHALTNPEEGAAKLDCILSGGTPMQEQVSSQLEAKYGKMKYDLPTYYKTQIAAYYNKNIKDIDDATIDDATIDSEVKAAREQVGRALLASFGKVFWLLGQGPQAGKEAQDAMDAKKKVFRREELVVMANKKTLRERAKEKLDGCTKPLVILGGDTVVRPVTDAWVVDALVPAIKDGQMRAAYHDFDCILSHDYRAFSMEQQVIASLQEEKKSGAAPYKLPDVCKKIIVDLQGAYGLDLKDGTEPPKEMVEQAGNQLATTYGQVFWFLRQAASQAESNRGTVRVQRADLIWMANQKPLHKYAVDEVRKMMAEGGKKTPLAIVGGDVNADTGIVGKMRLAISKNGTIDTSGFDCVLDGGSEVEHALSTSLVAKGKGVTRYDVSSFFNKYITTHFQDFGLRRGDNGVRAFVAMAQQPASIHHFFASLGEVFWNLGEKVGWLEDARNKGKTVFQREQLAIIANKGMLLQFSDSKLNELTRKTPLVILGGDLNFVDDRHLVSGFKIAITRPDNPLVQALKGVDCILSGGFGIQTEVSESIREQKEKEAGQTGPKPESFVVYETRPAWKTYITTHAADFGLPPKPEETVIDTMVTEAQRLLGSEVFMKYGKVFWEVGGGPGAKKEAAAAQAQGKQLVRRDELKQKVAQP